MKFRIFLGALAALAMTALACLGLAGPASAAYGPESGGATVSATTVNSGGTVTVSGARFCPRSTVTLTVSEGGRVYLTQKLKSSARGSVTATVTVTEVGMNSIKLTGRQANCSGTRVLGVKVGVRAGNATTNGGSADVAAGAGGLPRTGGVDLTPLYAGLGLFAAGSFLVTIARSRRRVLI